MNILTRLFLFLLILCGSFVFAQEEFYHPELEWKSIETEHFYVHYHDGTERTARVVSKIAEEIFGPVTSLYNYKPDQKISFIIKDYDDYSNGAAYFFDNKIEIWAPALDFDLRGTHNWLRNVITHEFTHIIQIQTSMKFGRRVPGIYFQWLGYESERRTDVLYGFPNVVVSYPISGVVVPSWFAEGVAQYNRHELSYDFWDSHRDMILRMYALDSNMLSWNEMAVFGKTSLGNESSYNAGFAFVRYIAERYGQEKIVEISRNLSSLTELTIGGAIKRAVGKDGEEVYNEWREYLQRDYRDRTKNIKATLTPLDTIAFEGFGNFYPAFSPDGKKIAYVSNKQSDYFGQSGLYQYDVTTKEEKLLKAGVRSQVAWSSDGKKIYYSKNSRDNPHWSNISDVYVYELESEEATRISYGWRAASVSVSSDGTKLAFVVGSDGTLNLATSDVDGKNYQKLTNYSNGEQVYHPKWSPDGKTIIFDYSIKDGRDIAMVPASGGDVTFILATSADERNAIFTQDGNQIIFASDETGIFNLYQYNLSTKYKVQSTNVLGGTFMPSLNSDGKIAFANYTSTGYKIMMMQSPKALENPGQYIKQDEQPVKLASEEHTKQSEMFDWKSLRSYDDAKVPTDTSTEYKNIASSLSFIPFLRVDNYNPKNTGLEVLKPGLYMYSYDVLERYGFFAGAAANSKFERDLFFNFDFRGKLPVLYELGLEPAMSLEFYNITRKTDSYLRLSLDTLPVEISYNLIEFDVAFKQKLFTEALDFELRFAHSRYTANIGQFLIHLSNNVPYLVQASSDLYFIGNDISAKFEFNGIAPSRTMEIRPVGRKVRLRYDYEFNKFNSEGEYEIQDGYLLPEYDRPSFHKLEASWKEYIDLPGWKHTLSTHLRGGTIFGPPVDNFFDFYIGGLAGMKGYPFYSLGGNEFVIGNLTYRFPISEKIDFRLLHIYFDKLYAAVYGDVGNVWKEGSPGGLKFKKDVGVELRLEAFSYYAFPTRVFFNATYGLDEFERELRNAQTKVTYGKEWQFHFGVLFGFEFD
ncbi:MAG: PD40 domain-containing protein [Ignavibacteriae bacterium]|nr:PD40 domain-containing protein [Ignavibacteriota bacterium]